MNTANARFKYDEFGQKWAYLFSSDKAGRNVLVKDEDYTTYLDIITESNNNFHALYIFNQIKLLNVSPNPFNSLISKLKHSKRKLVLEGGELQYEVRGSDIYITNIIADLNYKYDEQKKGSGLFNIKHVGQEWEARERINAINTIHVAINGTSKDKDEAAKFLPEFINYGYPNEKLDNGSSSSYNLFYNPHNGFANADWNSIQDSTGLFGGSHTARRLAAAISLAHANKQKVNWTVHERGTAIFKEALHQVSKAGIHTKELQTVFYANPTVNVELVDKYRRAVGMKLAEKPVLMNDFSIHQGALAGNWVSELVVSWRAAKENNTPKSRGEIIANGLTRAGIIGGGLVYPGISGGTVAWALSVATAGLTNVLSSNANKAIISTSGDAINHYILDPVEKMKKMINKNKTVA